MRKELFEMEDKMTFEDEQILKQKEIKNSMEGFIYDYKRDIEEHGPLSQFIDPAGKDQLIT